MHVARSRSAYQEERKVQCLCGLRDTGRLICSPVLTPATNCESRGAHFRLDYPEADDARWRVVTRLELGAAGTLAFHTDPAKEPTGAHHRKEPMDV